MPNPEPHRLSAATLARQIDNGELTAEAAMRSCLDRIAEREPVIRAWAHLDRDAALAAARASDKSGRRGVLKGVPFGIKDIFDTADMPTGYGSPIYTGCRPSFAASAVSLPRAARGILLGKTVTTEFANRHPGPTANPHNIDHTPGGSSSGSAAAVADFMVPLAIGTQTGGSVIRPAAYCGVVGFKPTFALVPIEGCWPLAPSYDHAGPMARDVEACIAMTQALVPGFAPAGVELADLHVGLAWTGDAQPGVRARVEEAAALFPRCERIEFPRGQGHLKMFMREIAEVHESLFAEHADEYGEEVAWKLRELCFTVTDAEFTEGERARASLRDEAAQALEGFDLLLTPTQGFVAPTYEEVTDDSLRLGITRFTNPFNALGWPALALPCGQAEHGLPASVQLVGGAGADALVLGAGIALERALVPR